MMTDEKPIVLVKKKNIQLMLDYCLEKKLEFTVKPRTLSDEWDIEVNIDSIKKAIALGFFLRDNKLEVPGLGDLVSLQSATPKVKAKNEPSRNEINTLQQEEEAPAEEEAQVTVTSLADEKPKEEAFSLQF